MDTALLSIGRAVGCGRVGGAALLLLAPGLTTNVNEQIHGCWFYKKMGFKVTLGRSGVG